MRRRSIAAIVLFSLTCVALLLAGSPPRAASVDLGDPLDDRAVSQFERAVYLDSALLRRAGTAASVTLPLDRGTRQLDVQVRTDQRAPVRIIAGSTVLAVPGTPELRSYRVLLPDSSRATDVRIGAGAWVDRVAVRELRGVWSWRDGLALACLALIPALILLLTVRLSIDWSLVTGGAVLAGILALLALDRDRALRDAPIVALAVGIVAALPSARSSPGLSLLLLGGGLLRVVGIDRGDGLVVYGGERALATWAAAHGLNAPHAVLVGRGAAALAGTGLIAAVYALGRRLLSPRWSWFAAAFVAAGPLLVQQSQTASRAQLDALLVVLLVTAAIHVAQTDDRRWLAVLVGLSALVGTIGWIVAGALAAPVGALIGRRASGRWLAALGAAFVIGALLSQPVSGGLLAAGDRSVQLRGGARAILSASIWGMGPILAQLGMVGSVVGLAGRARRSRPVWIILAALAGLLLALAGASFEARLLASPVALLCITAALLLQTFARRLTLPLGRRTVRLLANTSLLLALLVSLAIVNAAHAADPSIAASRWLLILAADQPVLLDPSVVERAALVLPPAMNVAALPIDADDSAADALARSAFVVAAVDRAELPQIADQQRACWYGLLWSGRLGYLPIAQFDAAPRLGAWTFDERRVDLALRADRPRISVFVRAASPTRDSLARMLRCGR